MHPHQTLRNFLVHPKDKRNPLQTAEAIYEVPCKGCSKTYIGETGRLLKTRLAEHKAEADKISARSFTRSQRKASTTETFKSAIAEHVAATNHVIGWEEAKLIDHEQDKTTRWLKEACWIRNRGKNIMNKDEGLTNSITSTHSETATQEWWRNNQQKWLPCLSAEQSEQGSWEELKYFYPWVLHQFGSDLRTLFI